MKRWIVGLMMLSLAGLTGCSRPIDFSGTSAFWSVDCSVNPSSNMKAFAIKYIGKGNQPVSKVHYSFENSNNFQNEGKSDTQSTNLRISGKSTLVTPYVDEAGFTLRIQWNEKEETITVAKK
ncbi:hypothetical protein [Paenibacillus piri]|uniref:Lipoprotein n=1 Tax=Paenibacillus piri TaxID=2547395 RepID=A0A4R5KSI7_9BACL|nr:hypothetical protein [Paenibacillus piri]TDF98008.1 hypothetical protein E1757_10850 [Paenibacillus piri]